MKIRKIFKRFITWYGWMIQKKTLLSCFIFILVPLIICVILDSLFFPALSIGKTSVKIGPVLMTFLLSDLLLTAFAGFNYTNSTKNYRFAINEGNKEMKEMQKRTKPEFLTEYVSKFEEVKNRARKSLDPAETNEWIENFKKLWGLKRYLINLKSSNRKDDEITMEQRIAAFRAKVIEEKLKTDNEIKQTEEEIYYLTILLLPG